MYYCTVIGRQYLRRRPFAQPNDLWRTEPAIESTTVVYAVEIYRIKFSKKNAGINNPFRNAEAS